MGLSIALVDDQDIVWARGFGWANDEASIPVTTDSVFRIGSVSKVFTTTAAMQQYDRGLLDIDDPFTNYLPGVTTKQRFTNTPPITIRMLINYHSGLPGDLLRGGFTTEPYPGFFNWITNYLSTTYPTYPPNYIWNYCNTAFTLMEGVIENTELSGDPFTTIVNTTLFEPLGMHSTSFLKDKASISNNLVNNYNAYGNQQPEEFVNIYGTGGMYSSPSDLAQFMKMLFNDGIATNGTRILETNSLAMMFEAQGTNLPLDEYFTFTPGLGWDSVKNPSLDYTGQLAMKSGGTLGFSAMMTVLRDHELGIAVIVNTPSGLASSTADKVLQLAVDEKSAIPVPTNTFSAPIATQLVSQAYLNSVTGFYATGSGYDLIEAGDGSLTLHADMQNDSPSTISNLLMRTNGWFSITNAPNLELLFTNVNDRSIIVKRTYNGFETYVDIYGDRFTPPPITEAWSNRIGKQWFIIDYNAASYFQDIGIGPQLTITNKGNVLIVNSIFAGSWTMAPTNDTVAFINGLNNRGGSTLEVYDHGGEEYIQFYGYQHAPEPPVLASDTVTTNLISDSGWAQWIQLQSPIISNGLLYEITLQNTYSNFMLRLYDSDAATLLDTIAPDQTLSFTAERSPLWLEVQPRLIGEQTGSFELAYAYPTLMRQIAADDNGNVVITWQGKTNETYVLSYSDVLENDMVFTPIVTNAMAGAYVVSLTNAVLPSDSAYFRLEKE